MVDAVNGYGYRGSGQEHYPYRFKSCSDYYTVSIDKRFKSPDCGSGHRGFESR